MCFTHSQFSAALPADNVKSVKSLLCVSADHARLPVRPTNDNEAPQGVPNANKVKQVLLS